MDAAADGWGATNAPGRDERPKQRDDSVTRQAGGPDGQSADRLHGFANSRLQLYFGSGAAAKALWHDVQRFAPTPYPVLLSGPTGSGKTQIAQLIGTLSTRQNKPFVSLALTSVPEELRHVELSGSTRGAFTGATRDRTGAVEAAHDGTLFIDELGHASRAMQQSLLTILEGGEVRRVGETKSRAVDVRFLFASATELGHLVSRGRFLEELYYRVSSLTIRVPSLAERKCDIIPLAQRFITKSLAELGKSFEVSLTDHLRDCLESAPWPGNVRQLVSICRYLAISLEGDRALCVTDLPADFRAALGVLESESLQNRAVRIVAECGGNKSRAAEKLGMSRTRLYRLLPAHERDDHDEESAVPL